MWIVLSVEVDGLACHAVKRAVVGPGIDPPEAGTADVGEPRTEAVAEQAEETEHHMAVRSATSDAGSSTLSRGLTISSSFPSMRSKRTAGLLGRRAATAR